MNENNAYGKIFCHDCKIRVKVPGKKTLLNKGNDERPPVEYSEGWRCADCAQIYRQKQSYKQSQGGVIIENKSGQDEKIIRAL